MSFSIGHTLKVQIFGQSHSPAMGCVIEGLPAGFSPDIEELAHFMARRAPGRTPWSTPRKEADEVEFLSGLNDRGETCGAPLAALIRNTNTRSSDYDELRRVPRPGHADFCAQAKWQGHQDVRGGGAFSARLTGPLCIAGGLALQILAREGVRVCAHVAQVADVEDERFDALDNTPDAQAHLTAQMAALSDGRAFPTIDRRAGERMVAAIDEVRRAQDSLGGIVECVATGLPVGLGSPRYDGLQGNVARLVFGIPAVKGLEFGVGFLAAKLRGSQNNDPFEMRDGFPTVTTNKSGGTLGGISTGAPLVFRVAVKPTPSIAQTQQSVDLTTNLPAELAVRGRHDPCVAPRAVPVIEAACALAVLDAWLEASSGGLLRHFPVSTCPDARHSQQPEGRQ